ncbi:MAG: c-type cytochrome, partial [Acidimicrobiia bacterium]|nr:c-type cytochrome [Acidimicrobiia bacterium]
MTPRFAALVLAVASALTGCAVGDRADEQETLAEGARLYEANCMQCHGGSTGGSIEDIPPRHNAEGHTWHHADCGLVAIVLEGMPQRADLPEMPAFEDRLTEDD